MTKSSQLFLIAILVIASFLNLRCKDEPTKPPPPPLDPIVSLTAEDASCTEVWLRLSVANANNPIITLTRDTTILDTLILTTSDSTIVDEGLLPAHTYIYTAQILNTSYSSTPIQTRTMDTTNHSFSWQTFQLGDGSGGSTLYDVAIINDTLAYAVGEIYRNDTTFNLAKWDGHKWELLKIQFLVFCDQSPTFQYSIKAVWAISENNILLASGSQIVRWNGQNQTSPVCIPVSVNKLWGEKSNSIYAVGYSGGIAHYNGSSWTKMESGTDIDLTDIYGSPDGSIVWACGFSYSQPLTVLLRQQKGVWDIAYDGNSNIETLQYETLSGAYTSVVAYDSRFVWVCSHYGMYRCPTGTQGEGRRYSFAARAFPGFPFRMRGNGSNDSFIAGEYGMIAHFNGMSWRDYTELRNNWRLTSVAQKGNLAVAVGWTYDSYGNKGMILIGRR